MVKSDHAREVRLATSQLGFVFEGTLENRHPHNSVLERDIHTLEEVTAACHLQAGFDTSEGPWQQSLEFAGWVRGGVLFVLFCFGYVQGEREKSKSSW